MFFSYGKGYTAKLEVEFLQPSLDEISIQEKNPISIFIINTIKTRVMLMLRIQFFYNFFLYTLAFDLSKAISYN